MLTVPALAQKTVLKLRNGYIKGITETGITVYKGIPYAQPAIGNLRFKSPQAALAWADTLDCTRFGSIASQHSGNKGLIGDENCLSLNIYQPNTSNNKKLPVLVWVHGGAMTAGSGSSQNGHSFADQDSIITVTINYRLGLFGFLYLGDVNEQYRTSGNNGLLDCIMALQWIKENIKAFDGDAARVTVMGESAGAKLTSTLLVAEKAKGLFSQLILESGGVQCIRDTATAKAIRGRLMKELGISTPTEILNLPTATLIAAQAKVCNGAAGTNYFGPVDDGKVIAGDAYTHIAHDKSKGLRFLIGSNKEESKMFMGMDKRLYAPDSTNLSDWFGNNWPLVLSNYLTVSKQTGPDSAATSVLTQYMYQMHTYRLSKTLSETGKDVWMYRFNYQKDNTSATHAKELQYVWYVNKPKQPAGFDTELAVQMHQSWVNFVKGNDPGKVNHYGWPKYKPANKTIMVLDSPSYIEKLKDVFNDPAYPAAGFKADR